MRTNPVDKILGGFSPEVLVSLDAVLEGLSPDASQALITKISQATRLKYLVPDLLSNLLARLSALTEYVSLFSPRELEEERVLQPIGRLGKAADKQIVAVRQDMFKDSSDGIVHFLIARIPILRAGTFGFYEFGVPRLRTDRFPFTSQEWRDVRHANYAIFDEERDQYELFHNRLAAENRWDWIAGGGG